MVTMSQKQFPAASGKLQRLHSMPGGRMNRTDEGTSGERLHRVWHFFRQGVFGRWWRSVGCRLGMEER
jgi:hypothetical protein